RLNASGAQEVPDRLGDEFRSVVAVNMPRDAADHEQIAQHVQYVVRGQASIHFQGYTLARVLVDDRQPLDRTAVRRAIEHEIPGPHVILVLGLTPYAATLAGAQSPLLSLLFPHLQALLTPQAIHPLAGHLPAIATQQHPIAPISVPWMLAHEFQ